MEIIKRTINNNNYTFICETWETSRTWGHKVTLFRNDVEYTTQKITYYNRTWESYKYKTCIFKCIETIIDEEFQYLIDTYKEVNNRKRLSQKEKDKIKDDSFIIRELKDLKDSLR